MINVNILVDRIHNLQEIMDSLKDKGFIIKDYFQEIGVLNGSISPLAMKAILTVPGVSSFEEERTDYHIQQ